MASFLGVPVQNNHHEEYLPIWQVAQQEENLTKGRYPNLADYSELVQAELLDQIRQALHPNDIASSIYEMSALYDHKLLAKFVIAGLETKLSAKAVIAIFIFLEGARYDHEAKEVMPFKKMISRDTRHTHKKHILMFRHTRATLERLKESGRFDKFMQSLTPRL